MNNLFQSSIFNILICQRAGPAPPAKTAHSLARLGDILNS